MLLTQGFSGRLITPAKNFPTSFCHFIRHIQSSKIRPFLICTALLFSANSYGDEYYQAEKIHVDHEQDSAILSFSGSPPETLEGYENYIIYNFNLTIGKKEYRLTEYDNYSHLFSKMKLGDLDYPVDNFPESRLVFSFSLSFTDFIIEARKCASKYSNFFSYLWDIWFNGDLAACNKNAWDAYWKKQNFIIDVTPTLKRAISKEIQSMTKEVSSPTSHFPMLILSSYEYDLLNNIDEKILSTSHLRPKKFTMDSTYTKPVTFSDLNSGKKTINVIEKIDAKLDKRKGKKGKKSNELKDLVSIKKI